jgi:tRNA dimethylallyltransferase
MKQARLKLAIQLCLCIPLVSPAAAAAAAAGCSKPPLLSTRALALFQGLPPRRQHCSGGGGDVADVAGRLRRSICTPALASSHHSGQGWQQQQQQQQERRHQGASAWGRREKRGLRVGPPLMMMRGGAQALEGEGKGGAGERIKVVVISGPTAVGKSALAERLAMAVEGGGEIISADSVQVYTGMDIGSNKPTDDEMAAVPYHLINLLPPTQEYSAADFADGARRAILDISSRGKLPIVVGGTGFYIQWLIYGRPGAPPPTPEAASAAQAEIDGLGGDWDAGIKRCAEVDPAYAKTLPANDWYRLRRVLEVFHTCGKPVSSFERPTGKQISYGDVPSLLAGSDFDFRCFFLFRPRLDLFNDIDYRCEVVPPIPMPRDRTSSEEGANTQPVCASQTQTPRSQSIVRERDYAQGTKGLPSVMVQTPDPKM